MDNLVAQLQRIATATRALSGDAVETRAVAALQRDADIVDLLRTAGSILRDVEAIVIEAAGVVLDRSDTAVRSERMTTRLGCGSVSQLLERTTEMSNAHAGHVVTAAKALVPHTNWTTGTLLEAEYPALREALVNGVIGVDAGAGIARELSIADAPWEAKQAASAALADSARGVVFHADGSIETGGPRPSADELRLQAQVWAVALDPDGIEPREERAMRRRELTMGRPSGGLVPLRGWVLTEIAAGFQRIADAMNNPKVAFRPDGAWSADADATTGDAANAILGSGVGAPTIDGNGADTPPPHDPRNRGQKLHDVFATVVTVAARSGELPTIGGAAPTLLVSVDERDLLAGIGAATIDGIDEPVSTAVARHVACGGIVQRVRRNTAGGIVGIASPDRVFNANQRRAITLRDGGCIIPGCAVRASWCEVHHVTEHARGGPTHTSNGVLLCWHHHRTLDTSGWTIRMRVDGVPELRGPAWWDPLLRWRPRTTAHPPVPHRRT